MCLKKKNNNIFYNNIISNDRTILKKGFISNIFYTFTSFNIKRCLFWTFMTIYTNIYLWSEVLQCSSLISEKSHDSLTVTTYAYDLLFVWIISYFLIKQEKIVNNLRPDSLIYILSLLIGSMGFALLGEVPFLKKIVIVKDFWNHLSLSAWLVILFIGTILLIVAIQEFIDSCKRRTLKRKFFNIFIISISYGSILFLLKSGKANDIIYHVHHAIFASILSLWYNDWNNNYEMCVHGVLMGVVIEGINFYGVQELFLFLTNGSKLMEFNTALSVALIQSFLIIITVFFCKIINFN